MISLFGEVGIVCSSFSSVNANLLVCVVWMFAWWSHRAGMEWLPACQLFLLLTSLISEGVVSRVFCPFVVAVWQIVYMKGRGKLFI